MSLPCIRCGSALAGGRFCPECGAEQPKTSSKEVDPWVGRTLGDRYEVGELIGVGGMGRIHRGLQRSLDRPVAIKFIHPHLLTSPAAVSRFMMEARAVSRLNHPNVVSVFDFGRTSPAEGGELYIVMELLSGSNLAKVIERESPLPLSRIADLLRQTLLALSEAHRRGITHRDVKPENISLERHHGDFDHVKVIDFGIASMSGETVSQSGQILGTPGYMAPEQVMGEATGPATDLYAVGVILFEMLGGRLPFEGSAATVAMQHVSAPRVDPRDLNFRNDIPPELALVCMRAMAIKPSYRFPDAEAFAEAIVRASTPRIVSYGGVAARRRRLTPKGTRKPTDTDYAIADTDAIADTQAMADTEPSMLPPPPMGARTLSLRPLAAPVRAELSLAGRKEAIAWCRAQIEEPSDLAALVIWGRPGTGKTRMLHELTPSMTRRGATVHTVLVSSPPLSEVGYSGLRRIILELSEQSSAERILAIGRSKRGKVAEGLTAIFGSPDVPSPDADGRKVLGEATAALAWAARRAIERSPGGQVMLVIDDVDAMDGSSLCALGELLRGEPIPGLFMLLTSESCPVVRPGDRIKYREIRGLSRAEVAVALGRPLEPDELLSCGDEVEPLYLEHWSFLRNEVLHVVVEAPGSLAGVIAARVQRLPPDQMRVLQSIALTGGGALGTIAPAISGVRELDGAMDALCRAGFTWVDESAVALLHRTIGQVVLGLAPGGVIAEMHAAVAESLASTRDLVELRAYHAIRGSAGLDSFLLLEEAANLRASRGDVEGSIAALYDAVRGAREQEARGEEELATSAWAIFGRKLASALLAAGREDEAYEVLTDILGVANPRDVSRALVLEQLAILEQHRGEHHDAKLFWNEALLIAEHRADYSLLSRFRRPIPPLTPSDREPPLFTPRSSVR